MISYSRDASTASEVVAARSFGTRSRYKVAPLGSGCRVGTVPLTAPAVRDESAGLALSSAVRQVDLVLSGSASTDPRCSPESQPDIVPAPSGGATGQSSPTPGASPLEVGCMPDAGLALDDAIVVECPRCSAVFVAPAAHNITTELAEVAALRGALDFVREIDCPECGVVIEARPVYDGGGDDDA
jgi:hypothetical protein